MIVYVYMTCIIFRFNMQSASFSKVMTGAFALLPKHGICVRSNMPVTRPHAMRWPRHVETSSRTCTGGGTEFCVATH